MSPEGKSLTAELAADTLPVRRSFSERRRLLRGKFNSEWWSIFFGAPIGNVLNALIADVAWITPNTLTWLGFLCKLVACPLLLNASWQSNAVAIALLQLNTVFDCMDGSLARYRKQSSVLGSFLDKITDVIGLLAVTGTVGYRVWRDTGDQAAMLIMIGVGVSHLLRGYMYWVVGAMEIQHGAERRSAGVDTRRDWTNATTRERLVMYVKAFPRVLLFQESDLYFWIGLFWIVGQLQFGAYFLGVTAGAWCLGILVYRYWSVVKLDQAVRRRPK